MSNSEVGSAQIAFLPTFKGFRSATEKEVDGTASSSAASFKSIFGKGAAAAGAAGGKSFKDSFQSGSKDLIASATADVAKASRELAGARAKELDITGRVRVAEAQLAEARTKYADGSSQVIRAEERAAAAARALETAQDSVRASTDRLTSSKRSLASASTEAAVSNGGLGGVLSRLPTSFASAGLESARSFGTSFRTGIGQIAAGSFLGITISDIARGAGELIGTGVRETFASVGLASDLSETTSAVTQVYGDAAADIVSFSSDANQKLGQTRTQALKAAQTFGVFAKQAGLTGKPLANFSTGLVTLSADLASFYNTSPDEAIQAIGAGLRGEAEPLRRFGVLLDDATLRAKALELGIYDGNDALTGQQRILAAQAVIFDQTGIAQGDFARTSEGLANQQRSLQASLEDTKTKFGEALLPAFESAATFANETLVPKLSDLVDTAGPKLSQALIDSGPAFENLWAKAEPLIDGLIDSAAEDGIPAFINTMEDVVDAAPGWLDFFDKITDPKYAAGINGLSDGIDNAGLAVHDFLFGAGTEARQEWWANLFEPGEESVSSFVNTTKTSLSQVRTDQDEFAAGMGASWGIMLDGFESSAVAKVPGLTGAGSQLGSGFARGITDSTGEVVSAISQLGDIAYNTMRERMKIQSPSRVFEELGGYTAEGFARGVIGGASKVKSAVGDLVAMPSVYASASAAVASATGETSRPIYADGSLFGWIRELANGEAQLVVAGYDRTASETTSRGVRSFQ